MLLSNSAQHPNRLEAVQKQTEVLPIDSEKAESLLQRARKLRNRAVHSNDLLILSSAADCDFLVTDDKNLQEIGNGEKPKLLSSTELQRLVEAAG